MRWRQRQLLLFSKLSMCVHSIIVVCLWKSGILLSLWQAKIGKWTSNLSGCVFLPARVLLRVGIHSLCVACQGAEHARSALKGAHCPHCVRLMMRMLRSQRALFEEGALSSVPRSSDPTSAKAEPCQCCRHIKLTCWKRWTRKKILRTTTLQSCVGPQIFHFGDRQSYWAVHGSLGGHQKASVADPVQHQRKGQGLLMDTPLAPSGLFGEAENTVVDRFQEAKKQAEAFQQFLPRRSAYGACLSSVPSGDRLVNPATPGASGQSCLQRVQLSASTQKCSSSGRLATSKVSRTVRSSVPAGPTLQGTDLVILITPEVSPERLIPLVDYLKAWKLLQNVSQWVLHTAERGYKIQFGSFPPRLLPSRWPLLTTESPGFTASISSFQRRMGGCVRF